MSVSSKRSKLLQVGMYGGEAPMPASKGSATEIPSVPEAAKPHPYDLTGSTREEVRKIEVAKIDPNPDQPRKIFDNEKLQELALSIKEKGVLEPITVSPRGNGRFTLVYGERRWRAAQVAGLAKIPALIKQYAEIDSFEVALIENIQREDLCPAEAALAIRKLVTLHEGNQDKVVRKIGKSASYVSQAVKMGGWVEIHGGAEAFRDLSWRELREMAYSTTPETKEPTASEPVVAPPTEKKKPQKPAVQVSQGSMKMIRFLSGLSKVSAEPFRQVVVPPSERDLVVSKIDGAIEKMKQNLKALEETKRSIIEAE